MRRTIRRGIACAALAIAWVAVPCVRAQDHRVSAAAPLPAQMLTARKVFISNGGDETLGDYSGGPDRAYNQLYAALKGLGRYELVAAPGDAELVFEISFATRIVAEDVSGGGSGNTPVSSKTVKDSHLRLAILDLKTHALLWTFIEHVENALLQGNRDKNFDLAMAALVNKLKSAAGPAAQSASGGV
jgi:hypothetical protein